MAERSDPVAERPRMPKGYGVPETADGLMAWSDVRPVIEATKIYWIASVRPEGKPHVIPIWGAWVDDVYYFEGGSDTRWGRNLQANRAMVVHLEQGNLAVMIEGRYEVVDLDQATCDAVNDQYARKYAPYKPEGNCSGWHSMRPSAAFAWEKFPGDATRFRF